jgi:hypothetical protein
MRLKFVATSFAALCALAVLAVPADAQTTRKRVYANRDQTVVVTRGEDGKTRTRVIIQKRSFLDPGPVTTSTTRSSRTIAPTASSTTPSLAATRPPCRALGTWARADPG